MQPRVFFVTHSQRFNTRSADRFGKAVFVMDDDTVSPFQTDRILRSIESRLQDEKFDPDNDFVALTGAHVFVALFLAHAVARYSSVKALLFDAKSSRYQERIIQVTPGATAGKM